MQIGDKISAQLNIRKASAVEGQYGPQWELECDVQWSKYPERFWIPREANESPPSGIKMVTLERTGLKDGKDGTAQFHWKYRIVEGEATVTDAPQTPPVASQSERTQTQPAQSNGWGADTQLRIAWAQSVNLAQATLGGRVDFASEKVYASPSQGDAIYLDLIEQWANLYYPLILKGPQSLRREDAPVTQPEPQSVDSQLPPYEPKNLGEFLTIAHQRWGMTRSQVADTLRLDLATIVDFGQALAQLEFAQMENVKG